MDLDFNCPDCDAAHQVHMHFEPRDPSVGFFFDAMIVDDFNVACVDRDCGTPTDFELAPFGFGGLLVEDCDGRVDEDDLSRQALEVRADLLFVEPFDD